MRFTVQVVAALSALCAASCASSTVRSDHLSLEATRVRVVGEGAVSECDFLGPVSKQLGVNFRSLETNIELVTIEVQNLSAEKGATHLVLDLQVTDRNPWSTGGCNNCVVALGRAYRCATTAAVPERAPPQVDVGLDPP